MRGPDVMQDTLFAVRSLESYVPTDHPLRPVRDILNDALKRMDPLFAAMYAPDGRDSIAPEKLLRALMLQVLYGVRSERMVIEQLGLQPAVSLVCRGVDAGRSVGSLDLFQESRSIDCV